MSLENQPKTVDDYKDMVKILKLKIIKQNKKLTELQIKNKYYQDQINVVTLKGDQLQISSRAMLELENDVKGKKEQKQLEMDTLKGKVEVMCIFVKGLKKLGITPQAVFRIADFAYKNYVESDYFRDILSNIKLGLTQKQISCLIFIFDDAYSGFITREDYYNSLNAYKMGGQDNYHQYIHECVFKLSQMMHQDKVNLIKFWEELEGKAKGKVGPNGKKIVDLNVFEEQIKKYYGSKMGEKEIVASFNAIDSQSQGCLEKSNFLYTITSFINKLLSGDEMHSKKTQNDWSQQKSQLTEPFGGSPKKMMEKAVDNLPFNQSSKMTQFNDPPAQESTPGQSCASRLQKQFGVTIPKMYQELSVYSFKNRMTLKAFKKHIGKLNPKMNGQFLSELFKEIDAQFKGSIYFKQLFDFYLTNSNDMEMILRLFGRYFEASDLNSEKFWFQFGLDSEAEISKSKFLQSMRKTFDSKDQKIWQPLWAAFSRDRDNCNVGVIIKATQKYES